MEAGVQQLGCGMEKEGLFDWLVDYEQIAPILESHVSAGAAGADAAEESRRQHGGKGGAGPRRRIAVLGCGTSRNSATAETIIPGVQIPHCAA